MHSIHRYGAAPRRRSRVAIFQAGLLVFVAVGAPAHATILLFDQARDEATQSMVIPTSEGGVLPEDYGDQVTGAVMAVPGGLFTYGEAGEGFTPDVGVDIFAAGATPSDPRVRLFGETGYADLVNVVFSEGPGVGGATSLSVLLTAAPGVVVDLYGFELGGWNRTDYTIAGVEVLAGAVPLFSESDVLVEGDLSGPGHTTFAFAQPLSAPELLLRVDLSNLDLNARDNIGIDTIRFGQTPRPAPEPGQAWLLLTGLALRLATRAQARRGSRSRGRPPREAADGPQSSGSHR